MKLKVAIELANRENLGEINRILSDWLAPEEVDYYIKSIRKIVCSASLPPKFDSHYYVAASGAEIVGVAGFRQPTPKLLPFAKTENPAELCMLYIASNHRCKGVGTALLKHLAGLIKDRGYEELIVRSAERFADTGWGFYDEIGFERVGRLSDKESGKISQIWTKHL